MNRIDKTPQQPSAGARWNAASPARWWHIGKASVSTEELQAWQLGPARTDHWLAPESGGPCERWT